MLRVGDFSKLAHVTVKTLRHYDELGLLRPVWTDRYTGYRYYNLDQLARLNRILILKEMGFSLQQIRHLLDTELPSDELRRMFLQKQRELAEQVQLEQERLKRIDQRIRQIEQEGRLPLHDVTLKSVPALWTASLRSMATAADLTQRINRMRVELAFWAQTQGIRDTGPWLTLHHHSDYRERQMDIEVALGLPGGQPKVTRKGTPAQIRQLEAVESMACLLQPAESSLQEQSFAALFSWTEQNRYLRRAPLREVLLEDPAPADNSNRFIEVQVPVESLTSVKKKLLTVLHQKENEMEPQFVEMPELTVVGLPWVGLPGTPGIPQTWDIFNHRCTEIKHVTTGSPAYGVCSMIPGGEHGEFEYTPSFAVDRVSDLPEGMVERKIPAGRYAVFAHIGPLDHLKATYDYIYQVWLPQSGYKTAGTLDFELYNEEFKLGAPDSRFYIYIPIQEA